MRAPGVPGRRVFLLLLVGVLGVSGCTVRRIHIPESTRQLLVSRTVRLIERPALSPAVWSSDGRRLAYSAAGGVWVAGLDGKEMRIAPGGVVTAISWSGPLNAIAVIDQGTVWTMGADGTNRRRLAIEGFATELAWSPGGDRLALLVRDPSGGGQYALWLASRDGGFVRRVRSAPGHAMRDLQWFPDGLYVFYGLSSPSDAVITEAWRVRVAYPDAHTIPLIGPARFVRLSPSGRSVAYLAGTEVLDDRGELVVTRLDGTGRVNLAPADRYGGVAWAPQSDKVVYARMESEADAQIWVADADGSGRLRVLDYALEFSDPSIALSLAWSPDGRHLAFGTNTGSFTGPVWVATLARR